MENKKWDSFRRSQHKGKPPRAGVWRPTIPSWEKKFCKEIGCVEWEALLEAKKYIHLYEDVMTWDDSAAREAFVEAKNRYWAQINGVPRDVAQPDPDLYIEKNINWDEENHDDDDDDDDDVELVDLLDYQKLEAPTIIFGDSFGADHSYSGGGDGWGDEFKVDDDHLLSAAAAAGGGGGGGFEGNVRNNIVNSCEEAENNLHRLRRYGLLLPIRSEEAHRRQKMFDDSGRRVEPSKNARAKVPKKWY